MPRCTHVYRSCVPVQEHRWRLLLPDGARYRYRAGDLRPAAATAKREDRRGSARLEKFPTTRDPWVVLRSTPGVLTDRVNVGGNESGQQAQLVGNTGELRGIVTDDHGQFLPGATVTLRPSGGKAPAVKVSNANGLFLFEGLAPGSYDLQAELEGFSTLEYPAIQLTAGRASTVEIKLSSAVEEVITVTAESPLLDERRVGNTQTFSLNEGSGGGWSPRKKSAPPPPKAPAYYDFDAFSQEAKSLKQGLVGGVKPLPIAIPETGKLLLLSGVLPPEKVGVELEVKGSR